MPLNFQDFTAHARVNRNIVMLTDHWGGWTTGIAAINQTLASTLSTFANITVYCVILSTSDEPSNENLFDELNSTVINCETGFSVPVRLVLVNLFDAVDTISRKSTIADTHEHDEEKHIKESKVRTLRETRNALEQLNSKAALMLSANHDIELLPHQADFIVGHAPVFGAAALAIRKAMYQNSKVILFYHSIPDEQRWTQENTSCPLPDTEDMVRLAEAADVVFSVTPKVHDFFEARFRSSARIKIDHRLFMPLCAKNIFDINGSALRSMCDKNACYCIVAFATGGPVEDWSGIDIAICAVGKVAAILAKRVADPDASPCSLIPRVHLTVLNVNPKMISVISDSLKRHIKTAEEAGAQILFDERPSDPWQAGPYRQLTVGACFDLCLVPTRSEPYGQVGLEAISAGLPTLVSEQSVLVSMIRRLVPEPSEYFVKTTRDVTFTRQDASAWCKRIIDVIDHPVVASQRALQLQGALMRDEHSRNTHDDFVRWLLGGIGVKFQLTQLQFVTPAAAETAQVSPGEVDGHRELKARHRFDKLLLDIVRQCWRVKRHSLQTVDDLPILLENLPRLPVCQLIVKVIDMLEDNDRRIVAIDCANSTVVVYCPDVKALRDLWAMCDRINNAFRSIILPISQDYSINPVMVEYGLRRATTRVAISGPEYLHYKDQLVSLVRRRQSIAS